MPVDRLRALGRNLLWYLRELTGETAYEHYLGHHERTGCPTPPLDRRTFERRRTDRPVEPGTRCC